MKSKMNFYSVKFNCDGDYHVVDVEAASHRDAIRKIMDEVGNSSTIIHDCTLVKETNYPKWAKWAFWFCVANLIGQIALVIENLINLKGN